MSEPRLVDDPVRDRLLEAAVRVFAREGYAGTRILDIVREAGLSTATVYGRFGSKEELLREAVVSRSKSSGHAVPEEPKRVAELIARAAALCSTPLSDDEAVRLEAYVTARREPQVAAALADARRRRRKAVQPLVDAAHLDGTVAEGVDPDAVLFLAQTLYLGMLLQRAADVTGPSPASWDQLIALIVASFGRMEKDQSKGIDRGPH
ncbi:MAG: helix-turn-helix domain-containing protein [Acidimicrobiales bacterium]